MAAKDAGKLVGILFLARDMAHRAHLSAKGPGSYAKHVALNEFYDSIVDLADTFAECYQGQYGTLISIPYMDATDFNADILTALEQQRILIESMRGSVLAPSDSALSNLVDEIINQYQSTLYKLQFLA